MTGSLAPASRLARPARAIRSWLRLGRTGHVGAIAVLHIVAQLALLGVMVTAMFDGAPAFVSKWLLLLLTLPFGPAVLPVLELATSSPIGEVLASIAVCALFAASSVVWAFAGAALIRPARRFGPRWWLQRFVAAGLVLVPLSLAWQREHLRAEVRAEWPRFEQRYQALDSLTKAEVIARLGPPDDTHEDDWNEDEGEWIAYHQERPVYRRGLAVLRFDRGRVESIDLVPGYDIPFDAADWLRSGPDRRRCMADDLVESGRLIDLSLKGVHQLLGPEDPGSYSGHRYRLTYDLGRERTFLDDAILRVRLGDDGRVYDVRLGER